MEEITPIWQQREVLSFTDIAVADSNLELEIVRHTLARGDYSWATLSIESEARIQQLLRQRGYEILCYDLNTFPTNSKDLFKYLKPMSLMHRLDFKLRSLMGVLTHFKYYLYTGIVSTIILSAGLIYYWDITLFVWSLLLAYVVCNCVIVITHDGWSHHYISNKNRVAGFILDYIGYIIHNGSRTEWSFIHNRHHKHWKQADDWDQQQIDRANWFLFLVLLYSTYRPKISPALIEEHHNKYILNLKSESVWLEKNHRFIIAITHIAFILLLGFKFYLYFLFIIVWLFARYVRLFNELLPHKNELTKEQEQDLTYYFPICTNLAYHASHHRYPGVMFFGKGWIQYLNVQYYFVKLFYRIRARVG
jgi:fatty-acid desaturase